jgi:hypothetical protein
MFSGGGSGIMKRPEGIREIHKIMEDIYEEDKELTPAQRVKKIKEESNSFLLEHKLSLKRIKPGEPKHVAG